MKKFNREEIDKWRNIFIERKYSQDRANLDGRVINYFILPVNLFQGIPNGLFRMTGKPQDGYLVGVSAEVPEKIKPHFAVSEHDEFMVYGLNDLDRTIHSEENILGLIKESDLKKLYLENKVRLYHHILENSKNELDSWGFTNDDYLGFVRAEDFLKKQLTNFRS